MPYTTAVAGTVITAAWANANVRDQVVTPFASAAARTSAITSPVAGMVSHRTDAKVWEGYNGTNWVQPATLNVAGVTRTSDVTMTTTETIADSITFTAIAGRRYKLTWCGMHLSSVGGDSYDVRVRGAAGASVTGGGTLHRAQTLAEPAANHTLSATIVATLTGLPAGQYTLGVFGVRIAGTGTIHLFASATYATELILEDIGV